MSQIPLLSPEPQKLLKFCIRICSHFNAAARRLYKASVLKTLPNNVFQKKDSRCNALMQTLFHNVFDSTFWPLLHSFTVSWIVYWILESYLALQETKLSCDLLELQFGA